MSSDWEFGSYAGPGPVTRDDVFFYNSATGLYVKQDGQRYIRAEASKLYGLLTWVDKGPALTKKGVPRKRQPPPHKDETEAYYAAQSLHFGVKPCNTKDATKRALLAAFGGGKEIQMPNKVVALEKDLRKLYHAEKEKGRIRFEQEEKVRVREEQERRIEERRRHLAILDAHEEAAAPVPKAGSSRKRKATDDGDATQKKAKSGGSASGKNVCHYIISCSAL